MHLEVFSKNNFLVIIVIEVLLAANLWERISMMLLLCLGKHSYTK